MHTTLHPITFFLSTTYYSVLVNNSNSVSDVETALGENEYRSNTGVITRQTQ